MLFFVLGLVLFFGIHMLPFYPEYRQQLIEKMDNDIIDSEDTYKIIFSVIALLGLIFVGIGKGSIGFIHLWHISDISRSISVILIFLSFVLIVSAYTQNNIKRYVSHPMLIGIIIWGTAHIITNGDVISLILFGSFISYSAAAIILANRRDNNENTKQDIQEKMPANKDAIVIGIAMLGFLLFLWLHALLFGRAVFP